MGKMSRKNGDKTQSICIKSGNAEVPDEKITGRSAPSGLSSRTRRFSSVSQKGCNVKIIVAIFRFCAA
jgi:hypothetical protein